MKKILSLILILGFMGVLFAGCKANEKAEDNEDQPKMEKENTSVTSDVTPEAVEDFVQEILMNVDPRAYSVDFTDEGEMYIVCARETGDGTLFQVSPEGALTEICKIEGEFIGPGMCIDSENYLYITTGHSLKKYSIDGTVETVADGFENAIDVCMDSENNLFVSDETAETIYKITPSGEKEVFVSYEKSGKRWQLFGIEYNKKDDCLYASVNKNIYKYPVTSKTAKMGGILVYTSTVPTRCIAFNEKGDVYLDTDNSIVELKADTFEASCFKLSKSGLIDICFGKNESDKETLYITTDNTIEKFEK